MHTTGKYAWHTRVLYTWTSPHATASLTADPGLIGLYWLRRFALSGGHFVSFFGSIAKCVCLGTAVAFRGRMVNYEYVVAYCCHHHIVPPDYRRDTRATHGEWGVSWGGADIDDAKYSEALVCERGVLMGDPGSATTACWHSDYPVHNFRR